LKNCKIKKYINFEYSESEKEKRKISYIKSDKILIKDSFSEFI